MEASEVWIFSEEFQPSQKIILLQNLEVEQEVTDKSDTNTETINKEEQDKLATKTITEKKNETMVETEQEQVRIRKTESMYDEIQQRIEEKDEVKQDNECKKMVQKTHNMISGMQELLQRKAEDMKKEKESIHGGVQQGDG